MEVNDISDRSGIDLLLRSDAGDNGLWPGREYSMELIYTVLFTIPTPDIWKNSCIDIIDSHPLFATRSVDAAVLKQARQTQASMASPQVESSQRTFNERRLRYNEKSDTLETFNYGDFNGARRRRALAAGVLAR